MVFGQTLTFDFVNYDDNAYVYENPTVRDGLTANGVAWAFVTNEAGNWHPLTWISHMLDCELFGLWAGGHHLTNLILHAATSVLLFLALWRMTGDIWPSGFVAMVFAVHPLHIQSVAWVAERKDVLSGFFFVLILHAYWAYVSRPFSLGRYLVLLALFALGLMTKPMLVTVPGVLLLLDFWPLRRFSTNVAPGLPWHVIGEKLPLMLMAALSCIATYSAQQVALVSLEQASLPSRLANAVVSYVAYLKQTLWPSKLCALYPFPDQGLPGELVLASLGLLSVVSVTTWFLRRKIPSLLVGWLWYLGMLVPVIGIVRVGRQAMADRYTYLPQIGLCIALAWSLQYLTASWRRRWLVLVAATVAVLVMVALASQQTAYWRDSVTLWSRAVNCIPSNAVAHGNLASALAKQEHFDGAIEHYRKAIQLEPTSAVPRVNLGMILLQQGRIAEAMAAYREAIAADSASIEAHYNLANLLLRSGQLSEAIAEYKATLRLDPANQAARKNLAIALFGAGQRDEAVAECHRLLETEPNNAAVLQMLQAMESQAAPLKPSDRK